MDNKISENKKVIKSTKKVNLPNKFQTIVIMETGTERMLRGKVIRNLPFTGMLLQLSLMMGIYMILISLQISLNGVIRETYLKTQLSPAALIQFQLKKNNPLNVFQ